jgi:hypothetical protein
MLLELVGGGGMVPRIKRLLKVSDTGVRASCEALRTSAKSGDCQAESADIQAGFSP